MRLAWLLPGLATLACVVALAEPTKLKIKPPIRGLVSMGAYRFVGAGGQPVNTLEPLNTRPGIFGGIVVVASWAQLQPTPDATLAHNNVIDKAMAEVRAYNDKNPERPLKQRAAAPARSAIGPALEGARAFVSACRSAGRALVQTP